MYQLNLRIVTMLFLIAVVPHIARAQVALPLPSRTVEALVAVLKSDAGEYEKAKACQQLAIVGDARAVAALGGLLSNLHLSTYARSALEAIDDPTAIKTLVDASDRLKGELLVGVIHSIGKRGTPDAIDALVKQLTTSDHAARTAAARAIARLATDRSMAVLIAELNTPGQEAERTARMSLACLLCAAEMAKRGEKDRSLAIYDRLAQPGIPERVRRMAMFQQIVAGHPKANELLNTLFSSHQSELFRLGLQAVRETGQDKQRLPDLANRMSEQTPLDQVILLHALQVLGDARVLPAVLNAAGSSDASVRLAAIQAMGALGDRRCLRILREGAVSRDGQLAEASRAALTQLSLPEVDRMVEEFMASDSAEKQRAGADLAGRRKLVTVRAQLSKLSRAADPNLRQTAIVALGRTASLAELPVLIEHALSNSTPSAAVASKQALKTACIRLPRKPCADQLGRALDSAPQAGRQLLLEMLTAVGGSRSLELVAEAARGDDNQLRDSASQALGKWTTSDAAPVLLELARSAEETKYNIRALRGLIRIARQLDMTSDQRTTVCRQALQLATRDDERRLVLEVLRRNPSAAGLELAQSLAGNPALSKQVAAVIAACEQLRRATTESESGFESLFDGKTLKGWHGNLAFWRVEKGVITGGDLSTKVKQNEFLRSDKEYGDFELHLQFQLIGDRTNGGVQIRTQEIPGDHEVSGYQADLGEGWWGCLYDESRRRRALAGPPAEQREQLVRKGEWNDYRIVCRGKRIQLWVNGKQTVDYAEEDPTIALHGIIALQTHGNLKMVARYRDIRIMPLGGKETK